MSAKRHALLAIAVLSMSISGPLIRFAVAPALATVVWRVSFSSLTLRAGEIIGIPLLDHLVVGHGRYVSFADRALL